MESASRIIERTLGQNDSSIDILKNYKNDENLRSVDQILSVEAMYEDESVRSRPVMYLQSSPHFSELFLAAYGAKGVKQGKTSLGPLGGEALGSPGMVAVWSHVVSTDARMWRTFLFYLYAMHVLFSFISHFISPLPSLSPSLHSLYPHYSPLTLFAYLSSFPPFIPLSLTL